MIAGAARRGRIAPTFKPPELQRYYGGIVKRAGVSMRRVRAVYNAAAMDAHSFRAG